MPISPENMALYPGGSIRSPEWKAIREAVRERAGDRCEECGVENHARGIRLADGAFLDLGPHYKPGDLVSFEYWEPEPSYRVAPGHVATCSALVIEIVCTVAHVDRGLTDHSMDNLRFWCQRCHNRHDGASTSDQCQSYPVP